MPNYHDRSLLGQKGEEIAALHLTTKGYQVRERNVRFKQGEIDLIVEKDEYLVFVEVKARYRSKSTVSPFVSMTKAKCNRIRFLGKCYLERNHIRTKQPRFDVIGIIFQNDDQFSLEHIENAF